MIIRPETSEDIAAVYQVNLAAFETPAEAELVDALREEAAPLLSLVAEENGVVIGHILFSPVTVAKSSALIMGLAPMAVAPGHQRRGIGSKLIRAGLKRCKEMGCAAVVVLGHPAYYPRFGFLPASQFGLSCEYDVPDEAFMVLELQPNALADTRGLVKYHPAFNRL